MRFAHLACLALGLTAALPALADDLPRLAQMRTQQPAAECYCRAQGRMFALGETACLRSGEVSRLAECGMALNNTSWRFTDQPCPDS